MISVISQQEALGSGIGIGARFLEAAPFILASLYYLFSPFFIELVRRGLIEYLEKVAAEWQGPTTSLPPHLTPTAIASNIDWIVDAPQMVPTLLLPLAATVFALNDSDMPAVILAFATLIICILTLWIYTRSPVEYRARRFIGYRYTLVSVFGIVLNVIAAIVLIAI